MWKRHYCLVGRSRQPGASEEFGVRGSEFSVHRSPFAAWGFTVRGSEFGVRSSDALTVNTTPKLKSNSDLCALCTTITGRRTSLSMARNRSLWLLRVGEQHRLGRVVGH